MGKHVFAALLALGIIAASAVAVISFTATPSFAGSTTSDCGGSN
jgi:hypothetical protein